MKSPLQTDLDTTYIYALLCPLSGDVRYVGKSDDPQSRLASHVSATEARTPKTCWIKSLLKCGMRPIVQVLEAAPANDWEEAERRWIAQFRAAGARLTNSLDGGEGWTSGRHHTDEVRRIMATARCGRSNSEYQKERARQGRRGRKKAGATSAYIGVHWFRAGSKWVASIRHSGKRVHLGYYHEEVEAARAYNDAAAALHGASAVLNDLSILED